MKTPFVPSLEDVRENAALNTAIQGAIDATGTLRARRKALAAIKWRLRSPEGQYVANGESIFDRPFLTDAEHAEVFDGRDSEALKVRYFSAVLKVPLTVELISFSV
jgi:hypothetical protein